VLVASVLVAGVLCSAAAPAFASAHRPAVGSDQAAAGWLARQMTGGNHYVTVFGGTSFPNQGLTIDAIFAFAATKSAGASAARATAWLRRKHILTSYIGNGTSSSFAGATAKVALAAEVRGLNPASFGGVNLLARLGKLITPSGRYSDHSSFGDFSNAFSQSLAILALSRHGGAPAKAVAFLASSECKNGGFPLNFAQKTCAADADATALDVQALLAAGRKGPAQRGLHWLARVQQGNGGLVEIGGGAAANANSTGLAGEAFAAGGWARRAALARTFLLRLQAGCPAPAARRGAIAYNASKFNPATAVSATAQGILGLPGVSLARLSARGSGRANPRLECSA
jgi:hypothetical protein